MARSKSARVAAGPPRLYDPESPVFGYWTRFARESADLDARPAEAAALWHRGLSRFGTHSADPAELGVILDILMRGVPLLRNALGWRDPAVGNSKPEPTPTDRARGRQWRLTMAYAGFELIVTGVLNRPDGRGLTRGDFDGLLAHLKLGHAPILPAPAGTAQLSERWFAPTAEGENPPLLRFLRLNQTGVRLFRSWLVERQPLSDWCALVQLAQTLRHLTAHGALSATKVLQLNLCDPLDTLLDTLGVVAEAVLVRVMEVE